MDTKNISFDLYNGRGWKLTISMEYDELTHLFSSMMDRFKPKPFVNARDAEEYYKMLHTPIRYDLLLNQFKNYTQFAVEPIFNTLLRKAIDDGILRYDEKDFCYIMDKQNLTPKRKEEEDCTTEATTS